VRTHNLPRYVYASLLRLVVQNSASRAYCGNKSLHIHSKTREAFRVFDMERESIELMFDDCTTAAQSSSSGSSDSEVDCLHSRISSTIDPPRRNSNKFLQKLRIETCAREPIRKSIASMIEGVKSESLSFGPATPAFVFDIDGVFKAGGKYMSFGAETIRMLEDQGIPYVFMTNGGGGRTEQQYAAEMTKKIAEADSKESQHDSDSTTMPRHPVITEDQMVLSYTPFKTHLQHLKDKPVLIVGNPRALNVARYYGFTKAVHLSEYTRKHPTLNPFQKSGCEKDQLIVKSEGKEEWSEAFEAILVFTDPGDFFEGIQVITDLLLSSRPGEIEYELNHRIPIIFSNPDLLWKSQFANSRFGQGAFRLSLEACYKARMQALGLSDDEISSRLDDFVQFGKPNTCQFLHARNLVIKQAQQLGKRISHVYMVGDNPRSDILGAVTINNRYGDIESWSGMLVRTGVYRDGDDKLGATNTYDDVRAVVQDIISKHRTSVSCVE